MFPFLISCTVSLKDGTILLAPERLLWVLIGLCCLCWAAQYLPHEGPQTYWILHKHLLADWISDLPTRACLFFFSQNVCLSLPLEAQLVSKDNEVTQKLPTCCYSLVKTTALPWAGYDVFPLKSSALSWSWFSWVGTSCGHLALPSRNYGTRCPHNFSHLFPVLIAVGCWVAMTTD